MTATRSDSLTRSSAASRMAVRPLASAPRTATSGNSSIKFGISSPRTSVPFSAAPRTVTLPYTSGSAASDVRSTSTSAPMRRSTSSSAVRRRLRPMPSARNSHPGIAAAAASQYAAEEKSPGTIYGRAKNFGPFAP